MDRVGVSCGLGWLGCEKLTHLHDCFPSVRIPILRVFIHLSAYFTVTCKKVLGPCRLADQLVIQSNRHAVCVCSDDL